MRGGIGFLTFISVFYFVGFSLLGYGLWSAYRSLRAGDWPSVEGSLTKVELVETHNDGTTWKVVPEYSYSVAGQHYDGSRLAYGYAGSNTRETHAQIYEKLKAARSVTVRYDPEDPATSTLSFGLHLSHKLFLAFSITWLAFVVGFTLLWWLISQGDTTLLQNLSVK
jgi:hypothetical protein